MYQALLYFYRNKITSLYMQLSYVILSPYSYAARLLSGHGKQDDGERIGDIHVAAVSVTRCAPCVRHLNPSVTM